MTFIQCGMNSTECAVSIGWWNITRMWSRGLGWTLRWNRSRWTKSKWIISMRKFNGNLSYFFRYLGRIEYIFKCGFFWKKWNVNCFFCFYWDFQMFLLLLSINSSVILRRKKWLFFLLKGKLTMSNVDYMIRFKNNIPHLRFLMCTYRNLKVNSINLELIRKKKEL
jgi:hypothetical protein